MAALTIDVVRGWRPAALSEAATGVGTAQEQVDAQVLAARTAMNQLAEVWEGDAARAAAERMAREATTGFALADALGAARTALDTGAADLGRAREVLLTTIDTVQADGFTVGGDGRVTAPTLPPVMTAAGDPDGAGARRDAAQRTLNTQAGEHAEQIASALGDVAATDQAVSARLAAVEVPQTLSSAVDAYLQRAFSGGDVLGALGAVGAGGIALAQVIQGVLKSATKGSAFLKFLQASAAPITHYDAMVANFARADAALDLFKNGKAGGGILRFVVGSRAATLLGKAFLPLTVVTGLADVVTGGGYEGARGWATRGFGLAGAGGAVALLGATALGLGPVGIAVAGAAVLAYGAWSVGNLIWDNREAIGDFVSSAAGHVKDAAVGAWNATTDAVSSATDWAGEQLDKAKDTVSDFGKGALDVLSFGLL
ncbi:MAG TPA: hypothetical protein VGC57_03410 [Cellulomonas sp.]